MAHGARHHYRHGVMVGNWHEDMAGMQLAANPQSNYNPKTHYQTETSSHYKAPGPDALIENYLLKQSIGGAAGVQGSQLFRHAGADTWESRYLTTYSTANHAISLHTAKTNSLRATQSAGGQRSPSKWQHTASVEAHSARSPPKSPSASASAAAEAVGGGGAFAGKSSGAANDSKQALSPSANSKTAINFSATGGSAKSVTFADTKTSGRGPVPVSVSESAPYHQPSSSSLSASSKAPGGMVLAPLALPGGRNKAGKPGGTWSRVPKMEVNPVNARAGDLSIEYAAFTLGGRKKPFPTVPDPSLGLERTAAKLDVWKSERDGAMGQRSFQTEHSGNFAAPSQAATSAAASGGLAVTGAHAAALAASGKINLATGQMSAAGTTSSQYHRDAQGNLRPHFRKHQQFKVAHDWGALKLRS